MEEAGGEELRSKAVLLKIAVQGLQMMMTVQRPMERLGSLEF
jgi:hypothetical protein